MKSTKLKFAVGFVLLAELATPFLLAAQKTSYKLIDIGTLGGPSAHGPSNGGGSPFLNNAGTVVGSADTSIAARTQITAPSSMRFDGRMAFLPISGRFPLK